MLKFCKKPIILYEDHRNIKDIVETNKPTYCFIDLKHFVKIARILGLLYFRIGINNKLFGKILYCFLRMIRPECIIGCNWITFSQKIYYLYAQKSNCRFFVMQHGAYVGGIVADNNHKYMRCDKFLVWGEYFKKLFKSYNKQRHNDILVFGNPIYNSISRTRFKYPSNIDQILIALSYMDDEKLASYARVFKQLCRKHTKIFIKYHNQQIRKFEHESNKEIKGNFASIVNQFDLIIVDHSTVLLDAIFFKKNVIFINFDRRETVYDQFLKNHFNTLEGDSFSLKALVDQKAQEELFHYMISMKNNKFDSVLNDEA